ncbi:zona pellucida sperm-binding protein 2-like isoform X1 [Acipenser ruthenus]|uniref:zona pellucida sperm-binding protein 2-like isoform X1 n=1 Tax=Acipenser ruthenus TaxID=7906 RepID=UPI0027421FA4|nr:zona pellucida sperm-binding protein 2-like isoform X1 [Acipenser ruthenus]
MLEHTWQDGPEKTKYTVLHPITTPFMPRPPVVTNNTVPKARVFNVTLGTFLPDVELVRIIVGPETLTVPEANLKGYNVQEHVFPNGSKTYTLQVPFEDPNVKQKVTPPDTRTYILPLTYLLNIVPENTPFTHPAVVEAILKDIIPPTVTGYCDGAAFYTMVTYGNMGRNWIPFVGSRELGGSLLALYKYNANSTNFWMTVPYNSVDATYEVISSSGIRSRLDLTLKDIGTMVVVADFSLSCSFPTKIIDCFTNGTMAALAVKVESVPSLSPSQLTLRDPSCRPLQSDAINAVFYFNVNSCGTTRRFDNNLLTYENEVLFTSYRLRVACHYLVNDTKVVQFLYQNNPAPVVQPGLGDLVVIMRLALDSTYNDFYGARDYPVVKYLRRPLYFEVELLYSRDPQAELFLENCWATYSADRNSSPKWDVVVDSCENSADEYLTIFHPVSSNARVLFPSHLKRFEVKMFSFTSGRDALKGQIYFHCGVVICDSNRPSDSLCSRRCIPGKQRLGRSAEGMDGGAVKAFVSSGPIELKRDGSLHLMPRSGHFNVWSLLGAAMGVCSVVVFVAGVVYFWKTPKSVC